MYAAKSFAKYASTHAHSHSGKPCTGGHGEILDTNNPPKTMRAFCSQCRAFVLMGLVHTVSVTVGTP